MTDKTLAYLTLGVALVGTYVTLRMAMELQQAKLELANKSEQINSSPVGQILGYLTGMGGIKT